MRTKNARNKKLRYAVSFMGNTNHFRTYNEIASFYPIWRTGDNVRNYFRRYRLRGWKAEKTREKYGGFLIESLA